MWTDRLSVKKGLTLMWLALAIALYLAARLIPSASAMPPAFEGTAVNGPAVIEHAAEEAGRDAGSVAD